MTGPNDHLGLLMAKKKQGKKLQVLFPTLKKLHLCTLQNLAMYRGSVSTFADLSATLGGAPRHVQRVRL